MITVNEYFSQEKECTYKDEIYSVRDNGAVMRHARDGKIKRKMDDVWTFGVKNDTNGYMYLGTARIHRIIASAFLEKAPSPQYVIDHIDTNKCNNRPENLRWVTRLENALSNPITRKRIILCCGSIENFLANPASLRTSAVGQNFDWMRTVSPKEAKISRDKLERWAKEDSVPTGNKKIGEWVFKSQSQKTPPLTQSVGNDTKTEIITESLTKNAVQINWITPTEFPLCPTAPGDFPLQEYLDRLDKDAVFAKNSYGESKVLQADFNTESNAVFVATYFTSEQAVKGYALAKIEYDRSSNTYYHESRGTFFDEDGVNKYFTTERGYEWTGGDVFDDFC